MAAGLRGSLRGGRSVLSALAVRPQQARLIGNDLDKLDDGRGNSERPDYLSSQGNLTRRQSDFVTFDPRNVNQEEEEERKKFTDFIEVYGEHRFGQ